MSLPLAHFNIKLVGYISILFSGFSILYIKDFDMTKEYLDFINQTEKKKALFYGWDEWKE
jgi:hypothetical protein